FAGVADFGFLHFQPQVGAFAGSFADAGEDGIAAVLLGDAGDELLNDHCFAQAGAAEEAGLAAAEEWREQVDDFNAGFENFGLGRQIDKIGRLAMDGAALFHLHRPAIVDGLAEQIEYAAEGFYADGNGDGPAGIDDIHAAAQTVGGAQGDSADA